MNLSLPFSNETIDSMSGDVVVLSENRVGEPFYKQVGTLDVKPGGDVDSGHFEVEKGVLRLVGKTGLFCEFTGTDSLNGVLFASGIASMRVGALGFDRMTLHKQNLVQNFGVCISSHVSYEKHTIERLIDSIVKAKVDMGRIVVVVGGCKENSEDVVEGVRMVRSKTNGEGFGGLSGVTQDYPYWLMLNDTCEVERSFSLFEGFDIGLNPDLVRTNQNDWTGFYSYQFASFLALDLGRNKNDFVNIIKSNARVIFCPKSNTTTETAKDVYGTGNRRIQETIAPIGIRRYRSVSARRSP